MDALVALLFFCQALGAMVGAVTAVWGEWAYYKAMHDGRVDKAERAHLDAIAHGLRYGMSLLVLSTLGLVIIAYLEQISTQPALHASYWTLNLLMILIIGIAWARSRRMLSFTFASAIVFSAWWFLVYLTLGRLPALTFGAALACLVVATTIFYGIFHYTHTFASHKR